MSGSAEPEWTDYRTKNGLDPLGMQVGSINLYQRLLPGVSNVTLRMRYYGFYAWLADSYARHVHDENPLTWKRHVRRAEAVYALAAHMRGGEGGIAGIQWASPAPFDPAEYLDTPEAVAAYLTEALETGDPAFVRDALGVVARAEGMSRIAKDADLSRESLYRSLGSDGNPEFSTVMRVVAALGLKLTARPAHRRRTTPRTRKAAKAA